MARLLPLCVMPVVLGVLLHLLTPSAALAHADLQQAEPAAGASIPTPPSALRLRFTEPLDRSATRLEVLDERGTRLELGELAVGPPNDRLLTVELSGLTEGVYTVRWWSLSQVDGHRWQGVYRFGVGRTPPPAEGTAPPLPSLLEVALQWLAIATTSLVLGGLAFRVWALEPVLARLGAAPRVLTVFGRALTATLTLLALLSVAEAVNSYGAFTPEVPGGATFAGIGKVGALALLRLFLVPMIGYLAAPGGSSGMALAFAALLVLTRAQAGHLANGGLGPVLIDATHQLAAGVWLGGAAAFTLVMPVLLRERGAAALPVGVRFGQLALACAGLALLSGVAASWALGLDPTLLLGSRYGLTLIAKLGLIVGLLLAALIVWRRRVAAPDRLPRLPLASEMILGLGVLLAAGTMALLPPPGESPSATPLDLVLPAGPENRLRVHLILDRVRTGEIQAEVQVLEADGRRLGQTGVQLTVSELAPLGASPAELAAGPPGPIDAVAEEQPDGRQLATFAPFTRPGWWRVVVRSTVHLQGVVETPFDVLAPDPNRTGLDPPTSQSAAVELFGQTVQRLEGLRSVRQRDALADGVGGVVFSTARYAAPDRYQLQTAEGDASVAVGPNQAFRRLDEPWRLVRRNAPFRYPTYRDTYADASAQRLGHQVTLDGQPARLLTFYVERDRAWYLWWLDAGDGLLRREVMVAPAHYMTTLYDEFDAPTAIELP
ncbi:MAG: copper resistance protein CopC/CopD [Chloroflexi bacterium]|nr:copper resistance protein CopC/CopD [Chloroflexota bacterium]